jgi:hypothetical protein
MHHMHSEFGHHCGNETAKENDRTESDRDECCFVGGSRGDVATEAEGINKDSVNNG